MGRAKLLGIPVLTVLVFGWPLGLRPAAAQAPTARGTVTAVSDASLTVKVGAKEMTFGVDSKTVVEAPGAGRQTRQARAAGAAGIKLTDVVKTGGAVLVTYLETNGKYQATRVLRIATAGPGGGSTSAEAPKIQTGTVKSVTAASLTITDNGKDWTFTVASTTRVIGRGAGTAAAAAGGRIPITSLVGVGDTVSASYRETGGAMTATEVRVTVKAR
jgi:hypothetical protein